MDQNDPIDYVTFSPSGETFVTFSQDSTLCIWDLNGTLISKREHTDLDSLSFSRDGKNIITNGQKVGEALYTSKYFCNLNYGWSLYFEYINLYTFNLYGDPSLAQQGINISGRPNKPNTPTGEASGKIDVEYTYTSSAIDPDNDLIYYIFNWGDGTDSGWLGPIDSGITYEVNHIWEKKGNYEIKVKAKDIYGAESSWSDPLPITMPYSYKPIPQILELLFQRFPHAFPILKQRLG